jgi:hypothetical protein
MKVFAAVAGATMLIFASFAPTSGTGAEFPTRFDENLQ